MKEDRATEARLLEMLGQADFLRLVEFAAGTRLYISRDGERTELYDVLSAKSVRSLVARYGGDYIRIPLARALRARHYRASLGMSNAQIAVRLGMTEPGVNQLFGRMSSVPAKGSEDPRQLKLFG